MDNKIVCRRSSGPWQVGDVVILSTETDETHTGKIIRLCTEPGYVEVIWPYKQSGIGKVRTERLMHLDDWKDARAQLANLKNYWK